MNGEREQLGRLVCGVAEHYALVAGTELLELLFVVEALGDVGGLLLDSDEDVAGLVIEALGAVVVADVLDRSPDDLLVVEGGFGGDLAYTGSVLGQVRKLRPTHQKP